MHLSNAAFLRPDGCALPAFAPQLQPNTDKGRAPVTYAWMAYTPGDRPSKYFHCETLYRLDRVGAGAALVPSQHFGVHEHQLREILRLRAAALLPRLPNGYRWIGPQLIEQVEPGSALQLQHAAPQARSAHVLATLEVARSIAARVLRERQPATQ